ncbi:MAG: hypothetical protein JXR59_10120 [Desulfuromonadaceae bacterium]|nr:hypothetical protein [Desulfuromonadaceae bacterium]
MNRHNPPVTTDTFDLELLAKFVYELNITRRQIAAYPPGHPLISQALDKAVDLINQVLEFSPVLKLGVAEDQLLLSDGLLDANNPVFKDFSRCLFDRQIALLHIRQGVTRRQLAILCGLLARGPEELAEQGGATALLADLDAPAIHLEAVDYTAFTPRELNKNRALSKEVYDRNQRSLWQRFIFGLLDGRLERNEGLVDNAVPFDAIWLANVLNSQNPGSDSPSSEKSYDAAISTFVRELAQEEHPYAETMEQFRMLVKGLNRPLRHQFLRSTFRASSRHPDLTKRLGGQISRDELVELLAAKAPDQLPANVLTILAALAPLNQPNANRLPGDSRPLAAPDKEELIHHLISQDQAPEYVPSDYQSAMERIIHSKPRAVPREYARQLLDELQCRNLEQKNQEIIFLLLRLTNEDAYDAFRTNLREQWEMALETGDFDQLNAAHQQLTEISQQWPAHRIFCLELLNDFDQPDFLDSLLCGLSLWGKASHPPVRQLLNRIGPSTIDLLLQRLSEEKTAALRHYYIHCLADFGDQAINPLLKRLRDHRWYYVRNLLTILRLIGQAVPVKAVVHLEQHPHPRVWQELIQLYRQVAFEHGEQLILNTLENPKSSQHRNAIQQAALYRTTRVGTALIKQLRNRPLSRETLDEKIALVHSLARLSTNEALVELDQLFHSNSLRHPLLFNQLRNAILEMLPNFPERTSQAAERSTTDDGRATS